jgi:hypothetical protein
LDHLLANFAERWLQGRGTKIDAVADFLTSSIDDHFEVEVPHAIALPIARVTTTLHEECRNRILTGVTHILGEERVSHVIERFGKPDEKSLAPVVDAKPSTQQELRKVEVVESEETAEHNLEHAVGVMEVETGQDKKEEQATQEDDGWTTVTKKKGGKKKGKQFE